MSGSDATNGPTGVEREHPGGAGPDVDADGKVDQDGCPLS
jgi:hypothetical protein